MTLEYKGESGKMIIPTAVFSVQLCTIYFRDIFEDVPFYVQYREADGDDNQVQIAVHDQDSDYDDAKSGVTE